MHHIEPDTSDTHTPVVDKDKAGVMETPTKLAQEQVAVPSATLHHKSKL